MKRISDIKELRVGDVITLKIHSEQFSYHYNYYKVLDLSPEQCTIRYLLPDGSLGRPKMEINNSDLQMYLVHKDPLHTFNRDIKELLG